MKTEEHDFSRKEWEELIYQWIFNEEDRKMLCRRLLDGTTFERLAEEMNLSTDQTKKRFYRARDLLFRHI